MHETDTESGDAPARRVTPEQRTDALREANRGSRPLAFLWEWTKIFWISVALFLVIRTFFVEAFKIPTGSMENTLQVGDFLLVNKLAYGAEVPFTHDRLPALERPRFGDVIVFDWPVDPTVNFVKRLVGLPGDTLSMHDGLLVRNGRTVSERYVLREDPGGGSDRARSSPGSATISSAARGRRCRTIPHATTGARSSSRRRHFFVLGDNRDNSLDSRYWGFVPDSLVTGRPILVYYSYTPDSNQALAWVTHVRWKRLGEFVR